MICHISNILFNNNMIKIPGIYVSTNWSLNQKINISWYRKISQHFMLDHPDFNNISIDNYIQERFPTLKLADVLYVACSLN